MPFQPGQSGNPGGRPKKSMGDDLRAYLAHRTGPGGRTRREEVIKAAYEAAKTGDVPALKLIFDRLDGAVPQPVQHSGPDGGPIVLQWQAVDE